MACGQCSTGGCGSINALRTDGKTNYKATTGCGSEGCSSGGCTKFNVFDWLSDMDVPTSMRYDVVEVKFKGGRKEYFRNSSNLLLHSGDFVACEMPSGYHIGTVSLQGELVRLQMIKRKVKDDGEVKSIFRIATEKDMEKHQQAINRDLSTMYRVRELIKELKLDMKLSDVEFQSDNSKATFYYSAEDRVDFRELIKVLAAEFRIRVEMKQISLRQEASRIGGLGSCGRELCCSTWLTDFKAIPTAAARYQNLSLNPAKLSGQCGRLKCCLNYELDTYVDALQGIPKVSKPLLTEKGEAILQKTDIFRRIMWFGYKNDSNWYSVSCDKVTEIIEMNESGKRPVSLEDLSLLEDLVQTKEPLNTELDQLDRKLSKGKKKPNKKRNFKDLTEKEKAGQQAVNTPQKKTSGQQPRQQKQNEENPVSAASATPKTDTQNSGQQRSRNKKRRNNRNNNRNQPPKNEA
jgi:cell fate regulator YaaT (PSP1 superfamily)